MKTRRNVSCDGMPFGRSRNVFNQCSLLLPIQRDVVPSNHRAYGDDQDVCQPVLDLVAVVSDHKPRGRVRRPAFLLILF